MDYHREDSTYAEPQRASATMDNIRVVAMSPGVSSKVAAAVASSAAAPRRRERAGVDAQATSATTRPAAPPAGLSSPAPDADETVDFAMTSYADRLPAGVTPIARRYDDLHTADDGLSPSCDGSRHDLIIDSDDEVDADEDFTEDQLRASTAPPTVSAGKDSQRSLKPREVKFAQEVPDARTTEPGMAREPAPVAAEKLPAVNRPSALEATSNSLLGSSKVTIDDSRSSSPPPFPPWHHPRCLPTEFAAVPQRRDGRNSTPVPPPMSDVAASFGVLASVPPSTNVTSSQEDDRQYPYALNRQSESRAYSTTSTAVARDVLMQLTAQDPLFGIRTGGGIAPRRDTFTAVVAPLPPDSRAPIDAFLSDHMHHGIDAIPTGLRRRFGASSGQTQAPLITSTALPPPPPCARSQPISTLLDEVRTVVGEFAPVVPSHARCSSATAPVATTAATHPTVPDWSAGLPATRTTSPRVAASAQASAAGPAVFTVDPVPQSRRFALPSGRTASPTPPPARNHTDPTAQATPPALASRDPNAAVPKAHGMIPVPPPKPQDAKRAIVTWCMKHHRSRDAVGRRLVSFCHAAGDTCVMSLQKGNGDVVKTVGGRDDGCLLRRSEVRVICGARAASDEGFHLALVSNPDLCIAIRERTEEAALVAAIEIGVAKDFLAIARLLRQTLHAEE
jgi:hypothetical protein